MLVVNFFKWDYDVVMFDDGSKYGSFFWMMEEDIRFIVFVVVWDIFLWFELVVEKV